MAQEVVINVLVTILENEVQQLPRYKVLAIMELTL